MLQLSKFPIKTLKSAPKVSDNKSTSYLLQAWFIRQEMAWVYTFLPFWLRVLEKIKQIVREEMEATGAYEIAMPALANKESWLKTERWNSVDVLFKLEWISGKEYGLNPTHEESVTPLMGEFIQSYKDLEHMAVFQFQNKFRNEKRAKSGLLRGREFLMKDLYSFHKNASDLDEYFDLVKKAYENIFTKLWIGDETYYAFASGWDFSKYSYEFQTKLWIGEDTIYICKDCWQAHNDEIVGDIFECVNCHQGNYETVTTSEVGNIFKLGTRFSDAFWLSFSDEENKKSSVLMGCYGIGISRLMWVIAEYAMDEKGLVWPETISPYTHTIIVMGDHLQKAEKLAQEIEKNGGEVIIDEREKIGFGQKAGDVDLMWIPNRIVISDRTLEQGGYEFKKRGESEGVIVLFDK